MLLCRYPNTFPSNTFQSDCILDISNLKNKAISIKDKTERNVRTDRKINDKKFAGQFNILMLIFNFHASSVALKARQEIFHTMHLLRQVRIIFKTLSFITLSCSAVSAYFQHFLLYSKTEPGALTLL